MKHYSRLISIVTIEIYSLLHTIQWVDTDADTSRFVVVSDVNVAEMFYPDIRDTKLLLTTAENETKTELDIEAKKRICHDITSSHVFRRSGKVPYEKHVDWFTRIRNRLNYPTKTISVMPYRRYAVIEENVFVCLARKGWSNVEYYVSDSYNLNAMWGEPLSKHYLAGRFVFHQFLNLVTRLFALAESSAEAFNSPDHSVEGIYLLRRGVFNTAWTAEQDALCKLKHYDKERICAAVLTSTYLAARVKFSTSDKLDGKNPCTLRTVTLQTELGESVLANRKHPFKEWMMSCKLEKDKIPYTYLLSHAYTMNQIFVYFLPEDSEHVFLEALTTNVRLIFDPSRGWFPDVKSRPKFLVEESEAGLQETIEYRRYGSSLSSIPNFSQTSSPHHCRSRSNRRSYSSFSMHHLRNSLRKVGNYSPRTHDGGDTSNRASDPATSKHRDSESSSEISIYSPVPVHSLESTSLRRTNSNLSRSFPPYRNVQY